MGTTVHADAADRFAVLLDDVVEPVRRYLARRTDASSAEDVLSETLLVCWRRLDEVPVDAPVAWALGVTRNCLANARRSERRRLGLLQRILHLDPPGAAPGHAAPGHDASAEGAVDTVTVALGGLADRDVELLRLWAWDELAPREIAVVLGVSVNAATVRLHRAKARLRARLSEVREPPACRTGTGWRGVRNRDRRRTARPAPGGRPGPGPGAPVDPPRPSEGGEHDDPRDAATTRGPAPRTHPHPPRRRGGGGGGHRRAPRGRGPRGRGPGRPHRLLRGPEPRPAHRPGHRLRGPGRGGLGGEVTLEVTHRYRGSVSEEVRVEQLGDQSSEDGPAPFAAGTDYLLSADGGRLTGCGLSGPASPELQALCDTAFG